MRILDTAGLYTGAGYLNFEHIMGLGYPYTIIVSMRGGGKTFGALSWCYDHEKYFLYFRRNKNALKVVTDPRYQIFKAINRVRGTEITASLEKEILGHYSDGDREIGLAASLSTFGSIRSLSAEDVEVLILDEFIPQMEERRQYDLFSAWLHADESITRNRVPDGLPEPRRILLANTDKIHGDILAGYGILDYFYMMQEEQIEMMEASPDMLLIFPKCEEIVEKKENTALYRTTQGTDFHEVALSNRFRIDDQKNIAVRPIREYIPVSTIAGVCIYRHKSRSGEYYISESIVGAPARDEMTDSDRRRFLRAHSALWTAFLRKKVFFQDLKCQNVFFKVYNIL